MALHSWLSFWPPSISPLPDLLSKIERKQSSFVCLSFSLEGALIGFKQFEVGHAKKIFTKSEWKVCCCRCCCCCCYSITWKSQSFLLFRDFWDIFIKGLTKNGNFIQNFNLQFSLVVYSIYNCINVLVIILLNCVISFVVPGVSTHTFFVHVELIFSLEYIVYWKTFRFFSLL